MSIHLLIFAGEKQIANLTEEQRWILQFFGASVRDIISFVKNLQNTGCN
jgi:hypothetical protein